METKKYYVDDDGYIEYDFGKDRLGKILTHAVALITDPDDVEPISKILASQPELLEVCKTLAEAAEQVLKDETDASEYLETEMVRAFDLIAKAQP